MLVINSGFYKLDSQVLKWDVIKDIEKIQLNHLLMQKENFERLKGRMEKGLFFTSLHEISNKLNITQSKARRLLKEFQELGIVTLVKKGTSKNNLSQFSYNQVNNVEGIQEQPQQFTTETTKENIEVSTNNNLAAKHNTVVEEEVFDDRHYNYVEGQCAVKCQMLADLGIEVPQNQQVLDTIKCMDMDLLKQYAYYTLSKGSNKFAYLSTVYLKQGGYMADLNAVRMEHERQEMELERALKKVREEQQEQGEQSVEPVEPTIEQSVEVVEDLEEPRFVPSCNFERVEQDQQEEQAQENNGDSEVVLHGFNFQIDCVGKNMYEHILGKNDNFSPSTIKEKIELCAKARLYAEQYKFDTTVIDEYIDKIAI